MGPDDIVAVVAIAVGCPTGAVILALLLPSTREAIVNWLHRRSPSGLDSGAAVAQLAAANAQLAALRGEVYALRCEVAAVSQALPAVARQAGLPAAGIGG